jgi:hypothetical protein
MEISFRLGGRYMSLSDDQVRRAIGNTSPEPVRLHAVEIDGHLYPTKQLFALATGLDRLDFTTNQARTQLRRLGFTVLRVGDER